MVLKAKDILQERYRIESLLGEGGMGAVYRAWDSRLNVPVALKEMTPQPGIHSDTLAQLRIQFQQEAQILARLSHPHLVRVGDFFEEQGNAYLVMDFIEGEELAARILREGPMSESQVLTWAGQILDALAYCHTQGIIHRDIKPQNVIIRPDGRVVLVDFGLVKLWNPDDPRTKTAMRGVGTPEYAPPEQYDTQMGHTDIRSDIYSLGATLYHALTGEAPLTATLRMADPEQFVPVRERVSGVSERTETAVMKALELARSQRWQNAVEMAQAMGAPMPAWTGEEVLQPAAAPVPRRKKTLKMEREEGEPSEKKRRVPVWGWSLGCLVVLALLAVLGGGALVVFGDIGGGLASLWSPGGVTATAEPTGTLAPTSTSTPTSTPAPTDTPTSTPAPTSAPTGTPMPTPVPAPTLLGPEDEAAYYLYSGREIVLVWEGARLGSGQRFHVIIEDESGDEVSLPAGGVVEEMEFRFTVDEAGIEVGTYRWTVIVEERLDGEWQRVSRTGEWWTLRFVPPPTPTPTPTNTPVPPPSGGGGGGGGKPKPTNTPPSGG